MTLFDIDWIIYNLKVNDIGLTKVDSFRNLVKAGGLLSIKCVSSSISNTFYSLSKQWQHKMYKCYAFSGWTITNKFIIGLPGPIWIHTETAMVIISKIIPGKKY